MRKYFIIIILSVLIGLFIVPATSPSNNDSQLAKLSFVSLTKAQSDDPDAVGQVNDPATRTTKPDPPADKAGTTTKSADETTSVDDITKGMKDAGAASMGACTNKPIQLGLPIPRRNKDGKYEIMYSACNLQDYMSALYDILIVIAAISAIIMIIYGGYVYITSEGNEQKTTSAKEMIVGAVIGLLLLLCAGLIISTIGVNK